MKKYILHLVSFILLFCFSYNARAWGNNSISQNDGVIMDNNIAKNELYNRTSNNTPDNMNKINIHNSPTPYTMVVFIGVPIGTLAYGMATWNWDLEAGFHARKEGFFGKNTGYGGADKVGHAYSHYIAFRILHNYYDFSENGKITKWYYSITSAVGLGLLIEVGDAYASEIGFSYEDLIADLTGIFLGVLLEYSPVLDSLIGYSIQYWPTDRYSRRGAEKPLNFTTDYNGAKFILNFRLAGLQNFGWHLPNFMRYLQFDFGYFTRNYTIGNETSEGPYRSLYYGISLNFMEIVKDFFENPESRTSRILQQPFKYYHIPAGYHQDYKI